MNPWLRCISGHSIVPHGELQRLGSDIQFVTQVREPVARAISQYKFWVRRMNKNVAPEEFLDHPTASNFQTKKVAGAEDLELAKTTISERYLAAGTVERFDEFLVLLARKLGVPLNLFTYEKRNEARPGSGITIPEGFEDELERRNQLDLELYAWIDSELYASYIASYDGDFRSDLQEFLDLQRTESPPSSPYMIDYVYRNTYWKPVTGAIRTLHGLPYSGSYGSS